MEMYSHIPQPPKSRKFHFLVDDINETKTLAQTFNLEKIEYNFRLIDQSFRQDFEIAHAFSSSGSKDVLDIGRYIVVVSLRKDKKEGTMTFFDSSTNFTRKEIEQQLRFLFKYSDFIIDRFLTIYDLMSEGEVPFRDLAELIIPTES